MSNVVTFRRYKFPNVLESKFLSLTNSRNRDFADKDLAKSGLDVEDIEAFVHPGLPLLEKANGGYVIPYYRLNGEPIWDDQRNLIMWRMKLSYPEFVRGQKYSSVSGEYLARYQLPTSIPYVPPGIHAMGGDELICAEGEKKCASIIKFLKLPAFGIGGCQSWREPDGSGDVHAWIIELIQMRMPKIITIVPDGDVLRYDICSAYGTFVRALQKRFPDILVRILHPTDKIDDLLVKWGPEKAKEEWDKIPFLDDERLVQSPKSLLDDFELSFVVSPKGIPKLLEHSSNITKLLEGHKAFPRLWINLDVNKMMLGDGEVEDKRTDMEIANYFQHNFGMASVKSPLVLSCMAAIARRNKESPFFEYIKRQVWDGVNRLDTWLTDCWGLEDNPYHREIASKFLISSCARQDQPGTSVQWMFITIGAQATGKTSMPGILFPGNAKLLIGQCDDKDMYLKMHASLCIGFDELDSFNRKSQEALKSLISTNHDTFRPPYGAISEDHQRRFVMYGSGNRYDFLQKDPSGYRRYAIVSVKQKLDFEKLTAIRDQLWAEAWQRYQQGGDKFWEVDGADAEARKYTQQQPMAEAVSEFLYNSCNGKNEKFAKDNIINGVLWFTMGDLMMAIGKFDDKYNPTITKQLRDILTEFGCTFYDKSKRIPPAQPKKYWFVSVDKFKTD